MSDALLPYYERELDAIKRLAAEFADTHPKIAGRLRLSADAVDDPHVSRLLEGMAFLAARVHHRLDDEFPELTDALLGLLYPHYLAPVPSCMVVQFDCQPDLLTPARLPAGMAVDTEPVKGETLRYRTTSAVSLWPVEVENVRLSGLPIVAPANPAAAGAAGVLRITLKCASPDVTFTQLGVDRLRFFLRGPANQTLALYELLGAHAISIAYADTAVDPAPVIVPGNAIVPAGFAPEEALLPWSARGFSGFRLLTEYFAFPEKFLFLDFTRIDTKTMVSAGNRLEIFVYLDRSLPELERTIGQQSLALGCTPLVNLFPQRCEPVMLTHMDTQYRIVPDARRPRAAEIWSVERVRETQPDGSFRPWRPFYRLTDSDPDPGVPGGFYHVTRQAAAPGVPGTEVFLAPHDPDFDPDKPADAVLSVDAICVNRDLPTDLPFGGGHPRLRLVEGAAAVSALNAVTAATPTLRPPLREAGFWRLVSHLSLGHLSVTGGTEGATALKEVLRLYDLRDTAETRTAIEALTGISAGPGTARAPGRAGGFCRGLDITLEFDPRAWQVGGLYLLASVLERFLALHGTVNSFTRTRVTLRGRPGAAAAWAARSGTRVLA
ncbi:MAG TPA: type VI secretion system baseplate subunit TssF [Acetobacteraceae bacterium]|jgi:type VI secretion system protein ImpG|nr:type VI secretion system baseplate subunit TssF [Acetobacteraceae bacterium]